VWLDCDIVFKSNISQLVKNLLQNHEVFYHLGIHKYSQDKGVESGCIGFKKYNEKFRLLEVMFDLYKTDKFKQYKRWDDSYMFKMAISKSLNISCLDIVQPYIERSGGHVICHGPFREYITHNKGIHQRSGLIIKNKSTLTT